MRIVNIKTNRYFKSFWKLKTTLFSVGSGEGGGNLRGCVYSQQTGEAYILNTRSCLEFTIISRALCTSTATAVAQRGSY
jgi:hypothetical protein